MRRISYMESLQIWIEPNKIEYLSLILTWAQSHYIQRPVYSNCNLRPPGIGSLHFLISKFFFLFLHTNFLYNVKSLDEHDVEYVFNTYHKTGLFDFG